MASFVFTFFEKERFSVVIWNFPDIVINVVTLLSASTALKWRLTEVSMLRPSKRV